MKTIGTEYRGFRFRSGLEVRWAVFFDAAEIAWEYEPEGYEMSDGSRYLPDFWLPNVGYRSSLDSRRGIYFEVKPNEKEYKKDEDRMRLFVEEGDHCLIVGLGTPKTEGHFQHYPGFWDLDMKFVDCPSCHRVWVIYGMEGNYYHCALCKKEIPVTSTRLETAAKAGQTHIIWDPKRKQQKPEPPAVDFWSVHE